MIKAVIDTNIVVSSLIQPLGSPAKILDLVVAGEIDLIVNDVILDEYETVLRRPKFGFPESLVTGFIDYLRSKASRCISIPQPGSFSDPDDKVFWDLAVTNNAVIVTGNVRHFPKSDIVMTPTQFLELWQ